MTINEIEMDTVKPDFRIYRDKSRLTHFIPQMTIYFQTKKEKKIIIWTESLEMEFSKWKYFQFYIKNLW